jgi:hypothetical protein
MHVYHVKYIDSTDYRRKEIQILAHNPAEADRICCEKNGLGSPIAIIPWARWVERKGLTGVG